MKVRLLAMFFLILAGALSLGACGAEISPSPTPSIQRDDPPTSYSYKTATSLPSTPAPTPGQPAVAPAPSLTQELSSLDLRVSPISGPPGTTVSFDGSGFTAEGRVLVLLVRGVGLVVSEPKADSKGKISGSFVMPSSDKIPEYAGGPVEIFATDIKSGQETSGVNFDLKAPAKPILNITPTSGAPGSNVRFSGSGFTPNGKVSVALIRGLGLIRAEVTADPFGEITGSFLWPQPGEMPDQPSDTVEVFAIDKTGGLESSGAIFQLKNS